jgi:hypothetical protein
MSGLFMLKTILKSLLATVSVTLMLLALVYTAQSRDARAHTPTQIGETRAEQPFLVEYAETRSELLMGFVREKFPNLNLPEPEAEAEGQLSLKALHTRAMTDRARAAARQRASR